MKSPSATYMRCGLCFGGFAQQAQCRIWVCVWGLRLQQILQIQRDPVYAPTRFCTVYYPQEGLLCVCAISSLRLAVPARTLSSCRPPIVARLLSQFSGDELNSLKRSAPYLPDHPLEMVDKRANNPRRPKWRQKAPDPSLLRSQLRLANMRHTLALGGVSATSCGIVSPDT